jgi:hypothetical protein
MWVHNILQLFLCISKYLTILKEQVLFRGLTMFLLRVAWVRGTVAQACNPSYLGGRDWEDCCSRPGQAKCLWDPISTNDWTWWNTSVIPAKWEAQIGLWSGHKVRPYLKINHAKMTSRVAHVIECLPTAYQVGSPEINT